MKHFFLFALIFLITLNLFAQTDGKFFLSADSLRKHRQIRIVENWKYHSGDDSTWAKPEFDDSTWGTVLTWLHPQRMPQAGWSGRGWFRLHLKIDSALVNTPLALIVTQRGASEIYLDGKLIHHFGKIGTSTSDEQTYWERNPKVILFKKNSVLLAVRYSNFSTRHFTQHGTWIGFGLGFGNMDEIVAARASEVRNETIGQAIITAVPVTFALLHLALFLFYPRMRANAYFALFALGFAALYFLGNQFAFIVNPNLVLLLTRSQDAIGLLTIASGIRFAYALFYEKLPKQFWFFLIGAAGFGLWFWTHAYSDHTLLWIFVLVGLIEMLRVIIWAIVKRKDGAWIIGIGFGIFVVAAALNMFDDLGVIKLANEGLYIMAGFFCLMASMSLYLSRNFAQTNKALERKLIEVKALSEKTLQQERQAKELEMHRKLLEAENARKTKELEEARQLQLSMLPQTVPQLPNLEIAVYMKTATEVGGDYYDFHLAEDGTLTVAIGDATGHGTKAGTVVTATKSLFQVLAQNDDSPQVFRRFTQTLKSMNLGRMYMAMTLIKFKDNKIKIAAAGMPPTLVYRAATKTVEEINIKAMPLGSFAQFPYKQEELELAPGDTIALMSDGLPEMFNHEGEILDYPAAKNIFAEVAEQSPHEIITHLIKAGETWANGRPQDDDVTFVVMKVTQPARPGISGDESK
ncbi:SpoIIE family protein phosphatase [candidate division KSB1 bacterium]|nr:SpoIIE family protein phosphatase [candidate division KSB1 bacterium]